MAYYAVPGSRIPLVLDNYQFRTSTVIYPRDWMPTHIRWILKNPYGETVYFKESSIDKIGIVDSGYDGIYHYTDWVICENTGFMQIPAFAEEGEWTLKAQFYNTAFGFEIHKDTETLYTIPVHRESFLDDLNAPIYFVIPLSKWIPLPNIRDIPVAINFALFVTCILLIILLIIGILIFREVKR